MRPASEAVKPRLTRLTKNSPIPEEPASESSPSIGETTQQQVGSIFLLN